MTFHRIFRLSTIFLFAAFLASPSAGATELNVNDDGVALKGYDPVAYFTEGMPVSGSNLYFTEYEGATYHFASSANMALFKKDPDKYRPAFGGYCSYGVRVGRKFNIDPYSWEIVDGHLYLLLNAGTYSIWKKKRDENITVAGQIWPIIKSVSDEELAKKTE